MYGAEEAVETALALARSTVRCSSHWIWPLLLSGLGRGVRPRQERRSQTVPEAGGTGAEAAGAPHAYRRSRAHASVRRAGSRPLSVAGSSLPFVGTKGLREGSVALFRRALLSGHRTVTAAARMWTAASSDSISTSAMSDQVAPSLDSRRSNTDNPRDASSGSVDG